MTVSATPAPATAGAVSPPASVPSLRRNFSWTFAGNVVNLGCNWGTLVALAKLGSPEVVGQFALGLAITAPVMMFTSLQLRSVQATDTGSDYAFGDYAGLRLLMTVVALMVIAGIAAGGAYSGQLVAVILLVGMLKALDAFSDVAYGVLQQREEMSRIAISLIAKGVLALAGFAGVLIAGGSLPWAIIADLGLTALVVVCYDFPSAARHVGGRSGLFPRFRWRELGALTRLTLPLGAVLMLISLNTNVPRYILEHRFGERELGVFAALAYLMTAGTAVIGALGQSATPRLARMYATGDRQGFVRLVRRLMFVGGGLGLTGLAFVGLLGEQLLRIVYTPEYAEHAGTLVVLMIAAAVGYVGSFLGYALTAARRFAVQAPLAACVLAATGGACLWLVPIAGSAGAAWALVISALAQSLGNGTALARTLRSAAPALGSR